VRNSRALATAYGGRVPEGGLMKVGGLEVPQIAELQGERTGREARLDCSLIEVKPHEDRVEK